jgi:ABC-type branched-subunit amino acid transport system substrate-binding protein
MKNRLLRQKTAWITVLAVALTALLVVTACAPSEGPPPIERKVVEIGEIGSLTGPGSSADQNFLFGVLDYAKYFNEREMIPGVTVEIPWRDSARNMERWLSAYEALKGRGVRVMMSNETLGLEPFQARVEKDQIPMYSGNPIQEMLYPPRWYYFRSPTWAEQFAVLAEYLMENWQEERPPKLAIMTVDSSFGRQVVRGTKYAEGLGFEILPLEFVPYVPIDSTTQLLRIREGGADIVYISWLQLGSGPIMRDAERLGLLDEIQFTGLEYSVGKQMIGMAGAAAEGFLVNNTLPSFAETEVPGIKLMLDTQMKYYGRVKVEEPEYIAGWVGTAITCEAVRRTVENVGYENLDGPAIKEAFDSIKGFDVDGLVTITYNPPDDHRGYDKIAVYQVQGGQIVRITDWRVAPMLLPEE